MNDIDDYVQRLNRAAELKLKISGACFFIATVIGVLWFLSN